MKRPRTEDATRRTGFLPSSLPRFHLNATARNVLKCSTAYFLASLFTYIDPLADFIGMPFDIEGPVSNGHFVASVLSFFLFPFAPSDLKLLKCDSPLAAIAVYYNPAKDIGAMVEADLFMHVLGLCPSSFLVFLALFCLFPVCLTGSGAPCSVRLCASDRWRRPSGSFVLVWRPLATLSSSLCGWRVVWDLWRGRDQGSTMPNLPLVWLDPHCFPKHPFTEPTLSFSSLLHDNADKVRMLPLGRRCKMLIRVVRTRSSSMCVLNHTTHPCSNS
jgi:hypothetical protein